MLSWASSQFDKLAQTVAPPPTDANGRFVYAVQRGDEDVALQCVSEIDAARAVLNPSKGTYAIHMACNGSMDRLIRVLLSQPGVNLTFVDSQGNTPLHYATMSTDKGRALSTVKMLVTEYKASVVAKNSVGQTPYDLASLDNIRQFLLPLQLQEETRQAIDNGGIGLPPGIDMGGLRITNPAQPPPPIMNVHLAPAPVSSPAQHVYQTPQHDIPQAPSSGQQSGYARTGSSSAAIYKPSDRRAYKADGFHSSSSDVNLQRKYGHVQVQTSTLAPPPPSSGNSINVGSAFPAPLASGPNPFAGGSNPYASGRANQRYVAYDAITGKAMAMPSRPLPPSHLYAQPAAANPVAPVPGVSVFTPEGSNEKAPGSAAFITETTTAQQRPYGQHGAPYQAAPAPSNSIPQTHQSNEYQGPSAFAAPGAPTYGQQEQQALASNFGQQQHAHAASATPEANSFGQPRQQAGAAQYCGFQQTHEQQPQTTAQQNRQQGINAASQHMQQSQIIHGEEQPQHGTYALSQSGFSQGVQQQQEPSVGATHTPAPTSGTILAFQPNQAGATASDIFASPARQPSVAPPSVIAPISNGSPSAPEGATNASPSNNNRPNKGSTAMGSVTSAQSPAPSSFETEPGATKAPSASELFSSASATGINSGTNGGHGSSTVPAAAQGAGCINTYDVQSFTMPIKESYSSNAAATHGQAQSVGAHAAFSPLPGISPLSSAAPLATDLLASFAPQQQSSTSQELVVSVPAGGNQTWNQPAMAARPVDGPREMSSSSSTAAELFASPGPSAKESSPAGTGRSPPQQQREGTGSPTGSDEMLDDVPLSPNGKPQPTASEGRPATTTPTGTGPTGSNAPALSGSVLSQSPVSNASSLVAAPGADSLFAAIGMPPPPFSSKR